MDNQGSHRSNSTFFFLFYVLKTRNVACNEDEISRHECLQRYTNFFIDENCYFYFVLGRIVIFINFILVNYKNNIKFVL